MLRKKLGKDAPKPVPPPTANMNTTQQRSTQAPKIDFGRMKDPINKEKIAELVTNKAREQKRENEVISKISSQMQISQKQRFKEFDGNLKATLQLNRPFGGHSRTIVNNFRQFLGSKANTGGKFKEDDYL